MMTPERVCAGETFHTLSDLPSTTLKRSCPLCTFATLGYAGQSTAGYDSWPLVFAPLREV